MSTVTRIGNILALWSRARTLPRPGRSFSNSAEAGTPRMHLNTAADAAKYHTDALQILDEIVLKRK